MLLTESTYGDRLHAPVEALGDELADVVERTAARGGKVMIPSFALERAQEIVYALKLLKQRRRIAAIPVYVDSPLTVKITDIFRLHPECYDEATRVLLRRAGLAVRVRGPALRLGRRGVEGDSTEDTRSRASSSRRAGCAKPDASSTTCGRR